MRTLSSVLALRSEAQMLELQSQVMEALSAKNPVSIIVLTSYQAFGSDLTLSPTSSKWCLKVYRAIQVPIYNIGHCILGANAKVIPDLCALQLQAGAGTT